MSVFTGATLGGPRPGMQIAFPEFRPYVEVRLLPESERRWMMTRLRPDEDIRPVQFEIFRYRHAAFMLPDFPLQQSVRPTPFREPRSVQDQFINFYLPEDDYKNPKWGTEALVWIYDNGTDEEREWIERIYGVKARILIGQIADENAERPCLIRIPADRVAEILGLKAVVE